MNEQESQTVYVYIDESGSITKTNVSNNRYFVISLVFTTDPTKIRRRFKKAISKLMKRSDIYRDMIKRCKEIKGSDISETIKKDVYNAIFSTKDIPLELGIIVLDNELATDKFVENHARAFNYMLQVYLNQCFRLHSRFMANNGNISLVIDEQNIATGAKYMLDEYLNQQLTLHNPVCDNFSVSYTDSRNEKLVQFSDFIANTFYRNIEKNNKESIDNIKALFPFLCNRQIFSFFDKSQGKLRLLSQTKN